MYIKSGYSRSCAQGCEYCRNQSCKKRIETRWGVPRGGRLWFSDVVFILGLIGQCRPARLNKNYDYSQVSHLIILFSGTSVATGLIRAESVKKVAL